MCRPTVVAACSTLCNRISTSPILPDSTAVKTDLPKAFDCIPHNPLLAKLSAYGFDRKPLIFILAYLKARIGSAFTDYINILFGVPNGPF